MIAFLTSDMTWLVVMIGLIITVTADPCGTCCTEAPTCYDVHGDSMEATLVMVALCGCFSDVNPDTLVTRYWNGSNMVGVNGVTSLAAAFPGDPSNTVWSAVVGTIDLQEYENDLCETPIGDPITVDVTLEVNCTTAEGNGLVASAETSGLLNPLVGAGKQVFLSTSFPTTYFQPGDIVNNLIACETDGLGYFTHVAGGGTLVITPP